VDANDAYGEQYATRRNDLNGLIRALAATNSQHCACFDLEALIPWSTGGGGNEDGEKDGGGGGGGGGREGARLWQYSEDDSDILHFSAAGYRRMGELLHKCFLEALAGWSSERRRPGDST
jgi:hypothetical protein